MRFEPRLDVLPPAQRRLWNELSEVPDYFVLYGGTAIALQLGHRQSVDFDLFGTRDFDPDDLLRSLRFLAGGEIMQREAGTLTCLLDRGGPVQVSFFAVPGLRQVQPPVLPAGVNLEVASLIDLAGTKASVIQKRAEVRDYIDMAALISHGIGLPVALASAQAIYGAQFNPQITLKALSYFGDGDLNTLPLALKHQLQDAARGVDLDALPRLEAR
ncbi:MAG: nucleotidyl transferase AbiEii/AbiGii toxin family protein [Vicinamibacterales bacterium]